MKSAIKIIVDKRIELMGAILSISDYLKLQPFHFNEEANIEYNEKLKEYFLKFKNHKIIQAVNFMIKNLCFNYSAPYELIIAQFDENLKYVGGEYDLQYKETVESKQWKDFCENLEAFAQESNFETFYNNNKAFYKKCIKKQKEALSGTNAKDFVENFYGVNNCNKEYYLSLAFADCSSGGHGLISNGNPFTVLHMCFENGKNMYAVSMALLVHEYSHPIINPLTEKYLKNNKLLDEEMKTKLAKETKHSWVGAINEYIIRSVEFIAFSTYMPKERQDKWIERNKTQGFRQIEKAIELMKDFNGNNETIEKYYSKLIKKLEKIIIESNK